MLRSIFTLRQILAWNLALLVLLAIPAGFVACQHEIARKRCEAKCIDSYAPHVSPANQIESCQECETNAEWHFPGWYRAFGWPNGVTAWALLLTLIVIAAQTRVAAISVEAARISAESSQNQASHIVSSERAWVIAAPQSPSPSIPNTSDERNSMAPMLTAVSVLFENKGKTPAFITKIATGGCAIQSDETPDLADVTQWMEVEGIPVVPDRWFEWEHERIEIQRAIKIRSGELSLWIYGIVSYKDTFGEKRTTGFCFRYEPATNIWLLSGPKDGNWAE